MNAQLDRFVYLLEVAAIWEMIALCTYALRVQLAVYHKKLKYSSYNYSAH